MKKQKHEKQKPDKQEEKKPVKGGFVCKSPVMYKNKMYKIGDIEEEKIAFKIGRQYFKENK